MIRNYFYISLIALIAWIAWSTYYIACNKYQLCNTSNQTEVTTIDTSDKIEDPSNEVLNEPEISDNEDLVVPEEENTETIDNEPSKDEKSDVIEELVQTTNTYIVCGIFGELANAQGMQKRLAKSNYKAEILQNDIGLNMVSIPVYDSASVEQQLVKVKNSISPNAWVLER